MSAAEVKPVCCQKGILPGLHARVGKLLTCRVCARRFCSKSLNCSKIHAALLAHMESVNHLDPDHPEGYTSFICHRTDCIPIVAPKQAKRASKKAKADPSAPRPRFEALRDAAYYASWPPATRPPKWRHVPVKSMIDHSLFSPSSTEEDIYLRKYPTKAQVVADALANLRPPDEPKPSRKSRKPQFRYRPVDDLELAYSRPARLPPKNLWELDDEEDGRVASHRIKGEPA